MEGPGLLGMSGWEIALMVISGFLAVTMLVRLMRLERDRMLERFRREMLEHQAERRQAETKAQATERAAWGAGASPERRMKLHGE